MPLSWISVQKTKTSGKSRIPHLPYLLCNNYNLEQFSECCYVTVTVTLTFPFAYWHLQIDFRAKSNFGSAIFSSMQTPGTQKQEKILKMGKLVCIAMMIFYSREIHKIHFVIFLNQLCPILLIYIIYSERQFWYS